MLLNLVVAEADVGEIIVSGVVLSLVGLDGLDSKFVEVGAGHK